jgi:hypothetical protein
VKSDPSSRLQHQRHDVTVAPNHKRRYSTSAVPISTSSITTSNDHENLLPDTQSLIQVCCLAIQSATVFDAMLLSYKMICLSQHYSDAMYYCHVYSHMNFD